MARLTEVVEIWEYERGLLYEKGKFADILEPGRYRLWSWQHRAIQRVSLREVSQTITGQEVLTTDKVPVRVTLIAQYAVSDPALAHHAVENYVEHLYQDLQLALRDTISTRAIDELLAERDALSSELEEAVRERAEAYGISVKQVGVKDVILPGSVQRVLLREVEAEREGRAELIAARHETAAARAKANTARIIHDSPAIMRLQELEALVTLASKEGNVLIVPGLGRLLDKETKSEG